MRREGLINDPSDPTAIHSDAVLPSCPSASAWFNFRLPSPEPSATRRCCRVQPTTVALVLSVSQDVHDFAFITFLHVIAFDEIRNKTNKTELQRNMGKKGGAKRLPNSTTGSRTPVSLREEATGKLQAKASTNVRSMLKIEHLKNLAVWASGEASIPSLGAFYGQCFASAEEAMGVPPDPSLITCQRCEIVLHPGFNCTIRIEKKKAKGKNRRKKFANVTQNNVVYKCHFCSHQNLKRGTPKGHMKGMCPSKEKSSVDSKPRKAMSHESARAEKSIISKDEAHETDTSASGAVPRDVPITGIPATPLVPTASSEEQKRKRNRSASNKSMEPASMSAKVDAEKTSSTSSKRRRKSWTSLKEIAKSSEHDSRIANLSIPLFL